jgi:amylovoran biosynthesis glycosyltransferase AmsB
MVNKVMFSVIIPVYNGSKTIRRPLDSLKTQILRGFEVVIVDDCSDDFEELEKIINDYRDDFHITVVRHKINKNGAAARNTGVQHANATYVAFLDSDDTWREDKLHTVNELIKTKDIDERTLIYSMVKLYRGDEFLRVEPSRGIKGNERVSDYFFCCHQIMQTSTFVCSKALAIDVGFNEKFTRHQDSSFAMEAQKKGCVFEFIKKPLVSYMFPVSGLKQRISQKRINSDYCDYWLKEMSEHLSTAAVHGYNFYVKSRVLMVSGRPFSALYVRVVSWLQFTPTMHLYFMRFVWRQCVR